MENDAINERMSYGYPTVFANIYEYERGNVSKINLDEALCIELVISEFSYAVLPTFFKHIIGVTGTLRAMPQVKKKILRNDYNVEDNFLIPSSYGINEKKKYCYLQVSETEHFAKIIERINALTKPRPVIVFFQSPSHLYEFFNSSLYKQDLKDRTLILTEEHEPLVR